MASVEVLPVQRELAAGPEPAVLVKSDRSSPSAWKLLAWFFSPLASLRLTVFLFSLSIFLILAGTLAQDKLDMWAVIAQYFRAPLARIGVDVFFPSAWFPGWSPRVMQFLMAAFWLCVGGLVALPLTMAKPATPLRLAVAAVAAAVGLGLALQSTIFGWFLFPGGAAVGAALFVNLLAAHALRFKVQARGGRLVGGLAVIAVGVAITWLIIASGHNRQGLQDVPAFGWQNLWLGIKIAATVLGLSMLAAAAARYAAASTASPRPPLLLISLAAGILATLGAAALWAAGERAYLGDAGMRILWQLIQGGLAGLILLAGCVLVFGRRGGIVLIHGGIGLLMCYELYVGMYAVEERIQVEEGASVSYAIDLRESELAIEGRVPAGSKREVFAVPESLLLASLQRRQPVEVPGLPLSVEVLEYLPNSDLRSAAVGESNPATAGQGLRWRAESVRGGSGADSGGAVDMASAYARFTDTRTGKDLGTYVLSQLLSAQEMVDTISVGDKPYDISLRFKRTYKPYSIRLVDVRKDDYVGTDTPRNYSSQIVLADPRQATQLEHTIWMNNPLRYAGETFYQSGYFRDPRSGKESTTLQLVTNRGWMAPYVACMLVVTGMLPHFGAALWRFLRRREEARQAAEAKSPAGGEAGSRSDASGRISKRRRSVVAREAEGSSWWSRPTFWVPAVILVPLGLYLFGKFAPPRAGSDAFQLAAFGQLPAADHGRVKPLDTLARTLLRQVSDREYFLDPQGNPQPAVRWLLDMIARPEAFDRHQVFRIHNLEVLQTLGLEPRPRFRYALDEIRGRDGQLRPQLAEFDRQVERARELQSEKKELSFYQRKLLDTDARFRAFTGAMAAFSPIDFPEFPSAEEFERDREGMGERMQQIRRLLAAANDAERILERGGAPLAVPALDAPEEDAASGQPSGAAAAAQPPKPWEAYAAASNRDYVQRRVLGREGNPAVESLQAIFAAYRDGEATKFNREVARYRSWLAEELPHEYQPARVGFEAYFNHAGFFASCIFLYVLAFALAACAWLGWSRPLNRAALGVLILAFVIHTLALIGRVYISGRPPVTNLYSSAVFIGWAGVLLGLILERVFRLGVGNVVAAVAGFTTLMIAHGLSMDGDTFTVMQAVLDTQFWLATHVVCITLGYATTFAAGMLGIHFVIGGLLTTAMHDEMRKSLARMIYGIVCFSMFFSFFGTVLGGLWADDSWGRFWGWDPKENGALIIVLWNAIILHARWGGMVRERGLALLAVGGNIATAWSWFGVNQLGIGLHSYGFTEGVLMLLALFVLVNLAVIALGCLPTSVWNSYRDRLTKGLETP